MSNEPVQRGYVTPELAARGDIPQRFCSVIASEVSGDNAYVLLNTGTDDSPYPYGVHCVREGGRWYEGSGGNGSAWVLTDEETDRGFLAYWDEAPPRSDAVSVRFEGRDYEVPVVHGHFLLVVWDASSSDWPQLRGFRVDGTWDTRSDRELRRERRTLDLVERWAEGQMEQTDFNDERPPGVESLGDIDEE
jgi:hypothetical protein